MFKISKTVSRIISIIVSLVFLVGGLLFFFNYEPVNYDAKTTGTIVEINEYYELIGGENELVHDVYIDYSAAEKTYTHAVYPEYTSGMKQGDKVDVYYLSSDPTQISSSEKDIAPYFGLIFAAIGLVLILINGLQIIRRR